MANEPRPEKIVDITGPAGEILFYHASVSLIAGRWPDVQAKLDQMWTHYKDITDERLLALVGALGCNLAPLRGCGWSSLKTPWLQGQPAPTLSQSVRRGWGPRACCPGDVR